MPKVLTNCRKRSSQLSLFKVATMPKKTPSITAIVIEDKANKAVLGSVSLMISAIGFPLFW